MQQKVRLRNDEYCANLKVCEQPKSVCMVLNAKLVVIHLKNGMMQLVKSWSYENEAELANENEKMCETLEERQGVERVESHLSYRHP